MTESTIAQLGAVGAAFPRGPVIARASFLTGPGRPTLVVEGGVE